MLTPDQITATLYAVAGFFFSLCPQFSPIGTITTDWIGAVTDIVCMFISFGCFCVGFVSLFFPEQARAFGRKIMRRGKSGGPRNPNLPD